MKRRTFIKNGAISIAGLSLVPISAFQQSIADDLLMGRKMPKLFGKEHRLLKEAHFSFEKMKAAAKKEGIHIKTVSSYRSYDHQNLIWQRKYKKYSATGMTPLQCLKKIIEYSTIPGTSRHHWGTDLDIVDTNTPQPQNLLLEKHFHGTGPFCKLREWMEQHAATYNFHLVYTQDKQRKGFKYEPWHYSYAPLSIPFLKSFEDIDLQQELEKTSLLGNEYLTEDFINQYVTNNVMDINPALLDF